MNKVGYALAALCAACFASPAYSAEMPAGKWVYAKDGTEEYERYVADSDGRVLIVLMHPEHDPGAPWGVFQNGALRGDYATKDQARAAGEKILTK